MTSHALQATPAPAVAGVRASRERPDGTWGACFTPPTIGERPIRHPAHATAGCGADGPARGLRRGLRGQPEPETRGLRGRRVPSTGGEAGAAARYCPASRTASRPSSPRPASMATSASARRTCRVVRRCCRSRAVLQAAEGRSSRLRGFWRRWACRKRTDPSSRHSRLRTTLKSGSTCRSVRPGGRLQGPRRVAVRGRCVP